MSPYPLLVLNCGSSSIKYALYDADAGAVSRRAAWGGKIEAAPSPETFADLRQRVASRLGGRAPGAVAHRVVHGGMRYTEPVLVDRAVLRDLEGYIPLAPLHQPFALEAIRILLAEAPGMPQVACFDTAFHRTLPDVERMLPLPRKAWERGIRRYGFHGLSYEYMARALAARHGDLARGRTIVAHLGSGASLCAMRDLRSVATTMGFSALDGVMMNTRCGSVDPGALLYLMQVEKLGLDEVARLLYRESGLLGVSGGLSSDPRELLAMEAGEPSARAALALYVRRIVRETGALVAVLEGVDLLAFTAGIGEHSAELRARVCAALGWLGVEIDAAANARSAPVISTPSSRVLVAVEPTDEEWIAASHAAAVLQPANHEEHSLGKSR
ncbi:MAG TPA: acetate/propionate family kinase [Usitatibacter sp.]|nr:acetate/propionate family kinase [Usitatibacter sp.]